MPLWSDYLQSVEIPAVTQIRASNDYRVGLIPGNKQWNIGKPSLIAHALGMVPFKDVFWTTKVQPGNPYNATEPNPELQTLVSILSAGLVGFGDKIGYVNRTLIMQTCNDDGLLLKPDKPATAIDRSFLPSAPNGEVYATYSNISGYYWQYVLAADLKETFDLYPSDLYYSINATRVQRAFSWHSPTMVQVFTDNNPIQFVNYNQPNWPFDYFVIIPPLANDFLILGELDKFVTMSSKRFSNLILTERSFTITISGSPSEKVTVTVAHIGCTGQMVNNMCQLKGQTVDLSCTFTSDIKCLCV